MAYDVAVVGGGIVGLATAEAITRTLPGVSLCVVDKEVDVGSHQTGHNSGVVHTGLYYTPGSLKARLCVRGHRMLTEFCAEHDVPLAQRGKVVVASNAAEVTQLDELERRGTENGLRGLRRLVGAEIAEIEPHAVGVEALHVPDTSVVDYGEVSVQLAKQLRGDLLLGEAVTSIEVNASGDRVTLGRDGSTVQTKLMVNCAGLQSDRVARLAGIEPEVKIVPFRGEYFVLRPEAEHLVRSLIYPVPDPAFPFLGVHFTRRVDDSVEVGPNAVLALGREFYRGSKPSVADLAEVLRFRGTWSLARQYWRTGAAEVWRSRSRRRYARAAQTLVPETDRNDLVVGGAGVRAQAVTKDGRLVDDFVITGSPGCVHVLNAPSPAATASLAIGEHIAEVVTERLRS